MGRKINLIFHVLALTALVIVMGVVAERHSFQRQTMEANAMKEGSEINIIIAYDNNVYDPRLTADWGFACVIETPDRTILFDTGSEGNILLSNLKKLGVDPKKVDTVFLSHIHSDHVGGLGKFLSQNPEVGVYYPSSFPDRIKERVASAKALGVKVSGPQQIAPGIYTTGEMGTSIKEQSLIIETSQGLLIITGCSHPGIVEMIERAEKVAGSKPYLVLGGFHLAGSSDEELRRIIDAFKSAGVQKVGPAHCSGDRTRTLLKEAYQDGYIAAGAGTIVEVPR